MLNIEKIIQRFIACFVSPLVLALIMTTFVYYEWNYLLMKTIAENITFTSENHQKIDKIIIQVLCSIVSALRSFGYAILVKIFYSKYKGQVEKLLDQRWLMKPIAKELEK